MGTGIKDYLRAGYAHFYVRTDEQGRALSELRKELEDDKWQVKLWGFGGEQIDPVGALAELDNAPPRTAMIFKNFQWFLSDPQSGRPTDAGTFEIVQHIQDTAPVYRTVQGRKAMIIVSSVDQSEALPVEVRREFVPLAFSLPSRDELHEMLEKSIEVFSGNEKFQKPDDLNKIVDAGKGMTLQEFENALFYSVIKTGGRIDHLLIKKQRAEFLASTAGVRYQEYEETFDSLKGYEVIKRFVKNFAPPTDPRSKGLILVGPPGTGKTHFGKSLAGEFDMFMLTIEPSEMMGGIVGETEEKVRSFIRAAKAMAPCILFIDEIEKGLAGIKGNGGGYSGDSLNKKAWAPFLKFMQDRVDDDGNPLHIYIIATCNDVMSLPPEYLRAERWDTAPFFIDLPTIDERRAIFDYYANDVYGVEGNVDPASLEGWSGAEIKALCRLAAIGGTTTDAAKEFVLPISKTMEDDINFLRKKVKPKCLVASELAIASADREREVSI